ncbi:MAG: hypothetical protein RL263_341, partial [Bacteroidota bacterium]
ERVYWQWFSMLVPLAIMIIYGIVDYFIRIKRYT